MSSLELNSVSKRYGPVLAVERASFAARQGEFLALLGPSGCGKSSTMRMIAGLETISEGEILFDGRNVNDLKPRQRNVALAFESYALYSPLSVYDNLAFPLQNGSMTRDEVDRRVRTVAEQFELTDLLDRKPANLSGGQSQRVSLARALVRQPNVLLLDEPLSHLDHRLRVLLRARVRHIHDTIGTTTVYVTHDQEEAIALADRIIVMNHARIQQIGTFEDLWERPVNMFVAGFVGDPQMNIFTGMVDGGDALRIGATRIELPADLRPAEWPQSGSVAVGVRPDRLSLVPIASGGPVVHGRVVVDEYQGDRSIVTIDVDGTQVKCVTAPDISLPPGAAVALEIDPDHVNLFDPETTLALPPAEARAGGGQRRAYG